MTVVLRFAAVDVGGVSVNPGETFDLLALNVDVMKFNVFSY